MFAHINRLFLHQAKLSLEAFENISVFIVKDKNIKHTPVAKTPHKALRKKGKIVVIDHNFVYDRDNNQWKYYKGCDDNALFKENLCLDIKLLKKHFQIEGQHR